MKEAQILRLLQQHISRDITTTLAQNSDSLDFRDVYIGCLTDLVRAAYSAGMDKGYEEGMEAAQEMAAVYAKECGE
jgi:hypothetical protein